MVSDTRASHKRDCKRHLPYALLLPVKHGRRPTYHGEEAVGHHLRVLPLLFGPEADHVDGALVRAVRSNHLMLRRQTAADAKAAGTTRAEVKG